MSAQDNIFLDIQLSYNQFTKTEKKIADYVLSECGKVLFMSITELADACQVAEASVHRFCRTMGARGYQEFKMKLSLNMPSGKETGSLQELLQDSQVEESRLLTEAALFADRISTDEEQVRLLAHIDKMRGMLRSAGSIGRNLDFLTQEMNREANTMLSKAGDLVTADTALLLKTQIEKIREQIQNIE